MTFYEWGANCPTSRKQRPRPGINPVIGQRPHEKTKSKKRPAPDNIDPEMKQPSWKSDLRRDIDHFFVSERLEKDVSQVKLSQFILAWGSE